MTDNEKPSPADEDTVKALSDAGSEAREDQSGEHSACNLEKPDSCGCRSFRCSPCLIIWGGLAVLLLVQWVISLIR